MKISTKGRYALRMVVDLAEHQGSTYIAMKDIAERQNISKKYLEQIVPLLTRAGVLVGTRGFQGGYRLAKPAENYTVGDILRYTEGTLTPVWCLDSGEECPRSGECSTLFVWQGLSKVIAQYLDSITIADIVQKHLGTPDDYSI
jgi:Rrf2 family protein